MATDSSSSTTLSTGDSSDDDRSWLIGGVELGLVTFFSMAGVFLLVMFGLGDILGGYGAGAVLGAFCAVWSGVGLATMVAFARNAARVEHQESAAAPAPEILTR